MHINLLEYSRIYRGVEQSGQLPRELIAHNPGYEVGENDQKFNNLSRGGAVWSARVAHNHEVVGSNPTPATKIQHRYGTVAQLVRAQDS